MAEPKYHKPKKKKKKEVKNPPKQKDRRTMAQKILDRLKKKRVGQ